MACPGSIKLIASLDDGEKNKAGFAAAEGTAAHQLCETALEEGCDAWEYIGNTEIDVYGDKFLVDDDMADAVQMQIDFVDGLREAYPGMNLLIEETVSSKLHPDAFGTADVLVVVPSEKRLVVDDYKHGRGIVCEPDSAQTKIYGYMAIEKFVPPDEIDDWLVDLYITQPRIAHPEGKIREAGYAAGELVEWYQGEVIPAMELTASDDAHFEAGDHCRFCPARGPSCPAMTHAVQDLDLSVEPEHMTGEEMGKLMKLSSAVKGFFEALEKEAFKKLQEGVHIPGYKLVKQKANRKLHSTLAVPVLDRGGEPMYDEDGEVVTKIVSLEDAVKEKFGDAGFKPRTTATLTDLGKLVDGKKFVADWAYKPDTGLTVAPEKDKRAEVKPTMESFMDGEDL
jgi:hypothetical protein